MTNTSRERTTEQAAAKRGSWGRYALVVACVLLSVSPLVAQTAAGPDPNSSSDLARENMSHVSASAAALKAVLLQDTGLLVELKRWVAKDATDHGQVISDSDLTDDAIFDRLEMDSRFRSFATALVQRYGYFEPQLNPESSLGKEQVLVIQERSKLIAQSEQEELAAQRQREMQRLQKANTCDALKSADCQGWSSSDSTPPQGTGGSAPSDVPGAPLPFNPASPPNELAPPSTPGGQLLQASGNGLNNFAIGMNFGDLNQVDDESSDVFGSFGAIDGSGGVGDDEESMKQKLAGDPLARANAEFAMSNGSEGLSEGPTSNLELDQLGSRREDIVGASGSTGARTLSPGYGLTSVVPVGPTSRRAEENATIHPIEMVRTKSPYENIPSLYDMYLQAVPRPATPRRFGLEVFQNGIRDPQLIPTDLPVGPDYVVGPGDGLAIDIWGGVSQRIYRDVDRSGQVSIPDVGPVLVSGKSLADLQQELQRLLRIQFRDVSAEVSLARLRTIRVFGRRTGR